MGLTMKGNNNVQRAHDWGFAPGLDDLDSLIALFRNAQRIGSEKDEPEGRRYIQISHTLANKIADYLQTVSD